VVTPRRIRDGQGVWHLQRRRDAYMILVEKLEGKRSFGSFRDR